MAGMGVGEAMLAASMGAQIGGAGLSAAGTILGANEGANASQAAKWARLTGSQYKAQELNNAANQDLAASQQQAIGATMDKNLALSKAQAVAAASGGGAGPSDTSVQNVMAGIEKQGEYNKAMSLFEGETRAADLNYQAQNALIEGQNDLAATDYEASQMKRQARRAAMGTILGGMADAGNSYIAYKKKTQHEIQWNGGD